MAYLQLNSVGLAFDGFGIVILGYAFFSKSLDTMAIESGTYYGGNTTFLQSLVQVKVDGVVGTSLLLFGFIFQWLFAVGVRSSPVATVLYPSLVVFLAVYFCGLRKAIIKWQLKKALDIHDKRMSPSKN